MTLEEAKEMLKAKRYCMELEISGTEEDCNNRNCDNCPYNYKQGNAGEQIEALDLAIKALEQTDGDCISREAVKTRLEEIVNEMETIFADIREKNVDDSVCGLCEYDCDHGIDGSAFECLGFEKDDCFKLKDEYRKEWTSTEELPSVTPKAESEDEE